MSFRAGFTFSSEEYLCHVIGAESSPRRADFAGPESGTLLRFLQKRSQPWLIVTSFVLLVIVGIADYLTGFERSLLVFYLLPVSLAAWFVSWRFAVIICLLSVAVWIGGDIAAGAIYSSWFVPFWNATRRLLFFSS